MGVAQRGGRGVAAGPPATLRTGRGLVWIETAEHERVQVHEVTPRAWHILEALLIVLLVIGLVLLLTHMPAPVPNPNGIPGPAQPGPVG